MYAPVALPSRRHALSHCNPGHVATRVRAGAAANP